MQSTDVHRSVPRGKVTGSIPQKITSTFIKPRHEEESKSNCYSRSIFNFGRNERVSCPRESVKMILAH